ncbi:partial putative protein, partial [Methanosarcinales archaeon]
KAAILQAEGSKQANILNAEGVRQSKILEAEGERVSQILRAQGEAQGLRIISVGSVPLDKKALTVLTMDMMKSVANGQATKIIFPMEISKLLEQTSKYLGASEKVQEIGSPMDTDKIVGTADEVLGRIPRPEELRQELQSIEKEMARETEESLKQAEKIKSSDLPEPPKKRK